MKRTISAMVGKGSLNHNSRKFKAENVNGDRTHLNIEYCNEDIRQVYHKLFDEPLARYNAKQTRADRRIPDYYEKIRTGKQEKLFHELIMQIGNRDDTASDSDIGKRARDALDEYFRGFRERNHHMYVFSAHMHLDEATPHLHIDFVPFITGSKRGLDTRVSLKQALAAQGFRGGTRGNTEWNQWVESEKKQLALVMERYGFEWEQKGTHEEHLGILDFKKQKRSEELEKIKADLDDKKAQVQTAEKQIAILGTGSLKIDEIQKELAFDPEYQLPEPSGLASAKSYRLKIALPVIDKLKALIQNLLARYFQLQSRYQDLSRSNSRLSRDNEYLTAENDQLRAENQKLKEQSRDYRFLRRVFGNEKIDSLLVQANEINAQKKKGNRQKYDSR